MAKDSTFLFWNLGRTNNPQLLFDCLREADVDIAVFAEWRSLDLREFHKLLQDAYSLCLPVANDAKVIVVAKTMLDVAVIREQTRYSVYRVSCGNDSLILVGAHLEDKRSHPSSHARYATARDLMGDMMGERAGCSGDAIILGDFNMEPYDEVITAPDAFNAVYFKDVIKERRYRTWKGRKYEFLYSPMLCSYSEKGPQYGSFYSSNLDTETYWHCLDQVLVTTGLVDSVVDVRHLRSINGVSLISRIKPNKSFSDHLPLLVRLSASSEEVSDGR